jgi:hypothetical protein
VVDETFVNLAQEFVTTRPTQATEAKGDLKVNQKPTVDQKTSNWETKFLTVCHLYELSDKDYTALIQAMRPIDRLKERLTPISLKALMSLYMPDVSQSRREAVADTYLKVLTLTK